MPDKNPDQETDHDVEVRVDKMMDPNRANEPVVKPADATKPLPPLNIYDDTNPTASPQSTPERPASDDNIDELLLGDSEETKNSGTPEPVTDPITDPAVDEAVDDIQKKEGDEVLAAQDSTAERAIVMKRSHWEKFKSNLHRLWDDPKKRYTGLAIILLIIILAALPVTRNKVLGLFLKEPVTITVLDSKTGSPVSGAKVSVGSVQLETAASGKATAKVKIGASKVSVSKQYYKAYTGTVSISLSKAHNNFKVDLDATGRQVPITVVNKITGKGVSGAVISVAGTKATTDKTGKATIVLPTNHASLNGIITMAGFNSLSTSVQVTAQVVAANNISITPTGKLYFLSNQTGKIDVVKTDLDGSNRQTVLAGSGTEDRTSTSLLASRDWKYLAFLTQRSADTTSVYLINTTTDKATSIDDTANSKADFNFVGWSGDTFVYQVNRSTVSSWQPAAQALKSYDASIDKLYTIDQTQGEGTSSYDYGFNRFSSVYILNNELVYSKNWYSSLSPNHLSGKSSSLVSVKPDGSNKHSIKDFPVPDGTSYSYYVGLSLYEPYGVYVQVPNGQTNSYYEYEAGSLTAKSDVTNAAFNQPYPTFLISPSDKQTFWSEQRDGKNALFVGDQDGKNPKQVAALTDYTPYGWYSDNYLLVAKNSSQLYILPADGSKPPLKLTDYYKPPINYSGYGGGYGGL